MPLLWDTETVRFEPKSDPGQWFDLKKELSSGDDDAVWEAVVKTEVDATAEGLQMHVRAQMMNRERVRRSVVAWSYARDGGPVNLTAENLDRLDRATYAELVAEVDRLNPLVVPRTPTPSVPGSSPTSAATARRPKK